jgi:uncharacterized protein (TIGR00251 family)
LLRRASSQGHQDKSVSVRVPFRCDYFVVPRHNHSHPTLLSLLPNLFPKNHLILHLHAKPNARHNQLLPGSGGRWTVRLAAPPQDGKANVVLLAFLAEVFGLAKSNVHLLSGHTAPFKKVELSGVSDEAGAAVLARYSA